MIRIDKFLSQLQVATRSESKKLIKNKQITKNGMILVKLAQARRLYAIYLNAVC